MTLLTFLSYVKTKREVPSNSVAFSEYINFTLLLSFKGPPNGTKPNTGDGKQNGMKDLKKNETVTSPTLSNNSEKNLTEAEIQVSIKVTVVNHVGARHCRKPLG